jgi:hypothetical protein
MSDEPDPLEIFQALGWELESSGSQKVCFCPFCGKKKLYVNPKTTTWDCKVCLEKGNSVTVLRSMHEKVYRPALDEKAIAKLAAYRGVPEEAFQLTPSLGYDTDSGRYTWLVCKLNGMPTSLRTFVLPKPGKKNAVRALKGTHLGLLGGELLGDEDRKSEPVYVCEGEWDMHAWMWVLNEAGKPGIVVALPGAGVFGKDWIGWFNGREVIGLYDCDEAGRAGSVRCWERIRPVAKSVKFCHWPTGEDEGAHPDGWDVHDLVKQNLGSPVKAYDYVHGLLKVTPTGQATDSNALVGNDDRRNSQEELPPITVEELHKVFSKWLLLRNHDLLDVTMAVMWTLYLPGNPLWMFIVAPPSGSKSETIMPISAWWRVHALSNMTSKSLISGFQGPGGSDPSLLSALDGTRAALAIKDLTPLLQGRPEERDEVFGILRDAYDGSVSKVFGNGLRREYKALHFTMLAGVTPSIDTISSVALGERFLKFRADRDLDREDDIERAVRAISNCGQEDQMREELRDACVRSLVRPFDPLRVPRPSPDVTQHVAKLAWLIANMRAVAPTEKGSDRQTMSPMAEAPPRLATQFIKFSQGLALHFESDDLNDPRITRLLCRVALHTIDVITASIVHVLYSGHSSTGCDMQAIAILCKKYSRETIRDVLVRLCRIGFVDPVKQDTQLAYRLTDNVYELLRTTKLYHDLPSTDVHYRTDMSVHADIPLRKPVLTIKRKS